jgi:hypothetical protein
MQAAPPMGQVRYALPTQVSHAGHMGVIGPSSTFTSACMDVFRRCMCSRLSYQTICEVLVSELGAQLLVACMCVSCRFKSARAQDGARAAVRHPGCKAATRS